MPRSESFFNPYRWVCAVNEEPSRQLPYYQHCWQGLAGFLECTLEALTPLLIGSGRGDGQFLRKGATNRPFIPATSLKGMIRSLYELIGNAAIPFPKGEVDAKHTLDKAAEGAREQANWNLDIAARTFGYLNRGEVFAGLVRFHDAELVGEVPRPLGPFRIVVGQPRPHHHSFYFSQQNRKFYHHHAGAENLVLAPSNISQVVFVSPLPPGTLFRFRLDFTNLREEELNLLLYCLVLEEMVTVTLSPDALRPEAREEKNLTGPLRHKLGACKPQGAGSVRITVDHMEIWSDLAERYRGRQVTAHAFKGEELSHEIQRRIQPYVQRNDDTMRQLRAMLIYTPDDPRKPIHYPDYAWFKDPAKSSVGLKPTL